LLVDNDNRFLSGGVELLEAFLTLVHSEDQEVEYRRNDRSKCDGIDDIPSRIRKFKLHHKECME